VYLLEIDVSESLQHGISIEAEEELCKPPIKRSAVVPSFALIYTSACIRKLSSPLDQKQNVTETT
jgi:hypothetical protein